MKNLIKYISTLAISVHVVPIFSVDLGKFQHLSNEYRLSHVALKKDQGVNKQSIDYTGISKKIIFGAVVIGSIYLGSRLKAINERNSQRSAELDMAIQNMVALANAHATRQQNG